MKQIEEWAENPITIRLKQAVEKELAEIQQTAVTDCLFPGDPQKTQENLIEIESREGVWGIFHDLLAGDWEYFEEEDDE